MKGKKTIIKQTEEVIMQESLSQSLDVWVVGHCSPIYIQKIWEKAISSQDQTCIESFVLIFLPRPP